MTISLYDATVDRFSQGLEGVANVLEKGRAHYTEKGLDLGEACASCLWPDMLPLSFQIVSVAHHSLGALNGAKAGVFAPFRRDISGYDELETIVADTRAALAKVTPDEVDALTHKPMMFKAGERQMNFTVANFLLSFSLPNFYFHATTAYDILRAKGTPLGKRDYMGRPRMAT
jgi:hypothetical protein